MNEELYEKDKKVRKWLFVSTVWIATIAYIIYVHIKYGSV